MATIQLMTNAALRAIEGERGRANGEGYRWGVRDCSTLIQAVCGTLGVPFPRATYLPFRELPESRATILALRRYGSLGAGHCSALQDAGWTRLDPGELLEPCDVVSVSGTVRLASETYNPARAELHYTGIVGPDCRIWGWTSRGLFPVIEYERIEFHLRIDQCQSRLR